MQSNSGCLINANATMECLRCICCVLLAGYGACDGHRGHAHRMTGTSQSVCARAAATVEIQWSLVYRGGYALKIAIGEIPEVVRFI